MTFPPLDEIDYQDRVLMAEIGKLNEQLGYYILRYLSADARQAEPASVREEQRLADAMTALAAKVRQRANRRTAVNTAPALRRDVTVRRPTNGRPSGH